MKVLVIKMSSMGDVVHALPAVHAVASAGHEVHWVVEEAFAPIVEAHPSVARVISIGWRRWRRSLVASRSEMAEFYRALRAQCYDYVVDAQGLYKSAVVARLARGAQTVGMDSGSAREPGSARLLGSGVRVPKGRHAIDRLLELFAHIVPFDRERALSFGWPSLRDDETSMQNCLLLHGTTWQSKLWPESHWFEMARRLSEQGLQPLLLWGNDEERTRAERIAANAPAKVLARQPLEGLLQQMQTTALTVGVDSGLMHLGGVAGRAHGCALWQYGSTAYRVSRPVSRESGGRVFLRTLFEAAMPARTYPQRCLSALLRYPHSGSRARIRKSITGRCRSRSAYLSTFPYGGIQRDLMKIARVALARGHEVRIYAIFWDAEIPDSIDVVKVPVSALTHHQLYELYAEWVHDHLRENPMDIVVGMNKMPGLDVYYAGDSCYEEKARTQRGNLVPNAAAIPALCAVRTRGVRSAGVDSDFDHFGSSDTLLPQALRNVGAAFSPVAAGYRS